MVLYYNNEHHKHTWFIMVCSNIFKENIANWFLDWRSYHGPSTKILPPAFNQSYKNWAKVSPKLTELYQADHICHPENLGQLLNFPFHGFINGFQNLVIPKNKFLVYTEYSLIIFGINY